MMTTISSTLMIVLAATLCDGPIEKVADGFKFTEGPIWVGDQLLFSDIPANRIYTDKKEVFRDPSGKSNGLTLDGEGRLIAAEHDNRRVSRTERDGSITVLASKWDGKKMHSPNDVIVRSDGTIFFTDPPYGGNEAELDFQAVYAISPEGKVSKLIDDCNKPNGLALSPDEKILYVADTADKNIRAFDVAKDGTLSNEKYLCDIPYPDGIKVDVEGRIWATAADGVRVIAPDGSLVETIEFPEKPANCCFGDKDGKTLYVTARTGVYKVRTKVEGIRPGM